MKYLLDTDHISFLQRRSGLEFTRLMVRMGQHSSADFALSVVSFHEQVLGAHNFINRARASADVVRGYALLLETFHGFATAPVLPCDARTLAVFNELREQKVRVSTMDLRIAVIAIPRDFVLLTRNVSDFRRVPGLLTEDWTV